MLDALADRRVRAFVSIYVIATAVLAFLVFVWPTKNVAAFLGLLVLTLPVSLTLFFVTYSVTVLAVGPGDPSLPWGLLVWMVWTLCVLGQALVFETMCRGRRVRTDA